MPFYEQAQAFLQQLFQQLKYRKISIRDHWDIDHLCFRTDSEEGYQRRKAEFSSFGKMLIESPVNGRMISTFQLNDPILFQGRSIDLVELPAPKKGKLTKEGFEHIEIVVDQPFYEIKSALGHCQFDEGGLAKHLNQELEIELENCAIKFHHLSLKSVINLESQSQIYQALRESRVLELLKPYRPLVAGTFPLDLQTEGSDLDILMTIQKLEELPGLFENHFARMEQYQCRQISVDGQATVLASFRFQGVPFEVFAQRQESIRQRAYLHFQIEERLMRLGGQSFKQKVIDARAKGLKTEPAFAQILGLLGDPYEALLKLHARSENELRLLFH
jgi:uncharacterized protein